jgi:cysteine desulfurase
MKEVFFVHYLDHAATTPVPRAVADAMYQVLTGQYGNPSSQYPMGREAAALVAEGRRTVAAALGCAPERLFFTSCGTESDNWAIQSAVWHGRHTGRHIITTAVEHNAVIEPCKWLERQGYEVTWLEPDRTGHVTVEQVADALREDTVLVSMMLVNNETGCVFPVAETAELLRRRGSRALLHCDAVQGFLKVPCDPAAWGVDLMSLSAHKIGGPKGIGALYISDSLRNVRPLLCGGGQESGLRSGTEATAQIAGFAKAVELRRDHLAEKLAHMAQLKAECRRRLLAIDTVVPVGEGTAPHILSVSLPGYPSANIVTELGAQGICISAGSACHKGKSSHVVSALGLDKRTAAGVIRVSFGPETTMDDIDALVAALREHKERRFPML